jgi:hypothetical protein
MDPVTLLKFFAWHARRLYPPRRFLYAVYDYGGVYISPSGAYAGFMHESLIKEARDVIEHARRRNNMLAAAWLSKHVQPPLALWRLMPPPAVKRRILIFRQWNVTEVTEDGSIAVRWVDAPCISGFAWSVPYVEVKRKDLFALNLVIR